MVEAPRIYVDTCAFIDMAKHLADLSIGSERSNDVWHLKQLLNASRDGYVQIFTSSITIAECVGIVSGEKNPPDKTKRFFDHLFLSGRSGVIVVQAGSSICSKARNLIWAKDLSLKPADSVHFITAFEMRCQELLTRDGGVARNASALPTMRIIPPANTELLPEAYRQADIFEDQRN